MSELLPGEFAIRTSDTNNYLSWLYDQSSGTGTVITSATTLGQTEKFKLTAWTPQFTLIQTLDLQNVTVAPEGGAYHWRSDRGSFSIYANRSQLWVLQWALRLVPYSN